MKSIPPIAVLRLGVLLAGTLGVSAAVAPDGDFQTIPAARTDELTPANGWPALDHYRDWSRSLGGPTSNRFSTLDQITKDNVGDLQVAWTFSTGVLRGHEGSPLVVGDVVALETGASVPTDGVLLRADSVKVSEQLSAEVLSIPIFPELTPEQRQWVADSLADFAAGKSE